jgi:5-methylcytosine-specific restriction endonuclease McrBC GTP-binding regulatory subunit McrB
VYKFIPQAFLKAYTGAWKNQDEPFFLIIEEINRGNCAQIFGDLFQLLDRNDETGLSDYPISPDEDIQKFLLTDKKFGFAALTEEQKAAIPEEVLSGELMILPKNLHVWATMNTSDQSLFPIDSAFKRRWDWQYMPISNGKKGWLIEANGKRYDWWQFLQKINDKIGSTTNSEDKKLGYFFCKAKNGVIDADTFVGKVVFYIWNDVFKDFAEEAGDLFKDVDGILSFNKFYTIGIDGKAKVVEEKVERLLLNLGMEPFINGEDDEDENNGRVKYIIDGEIFKRKSYAGKEIMSRYLKEHPNLTFKEIKETFPDSMLVHSGHRGLIVSTDTPLDSYGRYYSPEQFTSSDGVTFKIYKQWTSVNINNIINFAKNQGLDIKVEESDGQGE